MGFEDLNAKVTAVAKITHVINDTVHGISLYQQMVTLRRNENYATWDHIKNEYDKMQAQDFAHLGVGTNTSNAARTRSVQAKGNEFIKGNFYRTETLTLHGWSIATTGYGSTTGNKMDQRNLDNLFIDFKVDIVKSFKTDEDIGGDVPITGATYDSGYNLMPGGLKDDGVSYKNDYKYSSWDDEEKASLNYRIHDLINIGKWDGSKYTYEYKVREGKEPPDPLYVFIENENAYSHEYQSTSSFNTVRQIIININADNTAEEDRPMIFFYDGPEIIAGKSTKTWYEEWRESWKYPDKYENNPRKSLPVILNLNADFKGILFMPNSPVVINGNDKNFTGFIVAKEYYRLKTADDFAENDHGGTKTVDESGSVVYKDDDGNITYTYTLITKEKSNLLKTFVDSEKDYVDVYPMFIDERGNVRYVEEAPSSFNLASSVYTSFNKVKLINPVTNNIVTTEVSDTMY